MVDLHHLFNVDVFEHDGESFRHFLLEKMRYSSRSLAFRRCRRRNHIKAPSVVKAKLTQASVVKAKVTVSDQTGSSILLVERSFFEPL